MRRHDDSETEVITEALALIDRGLGTLLTASWCRPTRSPTSCSTSARCCASRQNELVSTN